MRKQPQQSCAISQQFSCIQAAASVKLSCGYLGYCFIVPHGSNPLGKFSFFNYYDEAYHHRTQASNIPIPFIKEETKTPKKSHGAEETGGQCSRSSSAPPFHRIKGNHITSLCLNSEVAKSHVFLHILLAGRTPILIGSSASSEFKEDDYFSAPGDEY